ncbi:MAG: DNA cytosine methyltransferase [Alphaproteobacteria bacterium]|nr:DNA cytosine methyltransferase [Alphaproteobacteria bacterium]
MRTLDLFCGAGGSSAGARAAGAEILAGIDLDPIATTTFQDNFQTAKVFTNRLEELRISEVKRSIGKIDLLLASPECTNHTCAKGSAPRNEESRATAMHVVDYAEAFSPRWFVMENVVHMRPWSRYEEMKNALQGLGYNLQELVVDASHHGVAQSRRRLFLVGDRNKSPGITLPENCRRKRTVKGILDRPGKWRTTPLYSEKRAKDTLARAERAFEALGTDSSFLIVYYGTDGSGGWQPLTRPLRTITTVDRFALVVPSENGPQMRMLQVPELRRAMGFETRFSFEHGTRRDRIRLLGNGVCPPVMEAVVRSLTKTEADAASEVGNARAKSMNMISRAKMADQRLTQAI